MNSPKDQLQVQYDLIFDLQRPVNLLGTEHIREPPVLTTATTAPPLGGLETMGSIIIPD